MSAVRTRRMMALYALSSFGAVAVGCVVAANAAVPTGAWVRNIGAWILGGLLAWGLAAWPRWLDKPVVPAMLAWLIAGALLVTFLDPGLEGVYRWVTLGPVRLNAAMLLLPPAIVLLTTARGGTVATVAITALLAAQPDASQATAFAGAVLVALWARERAWANVTAGLLVAALTVAAWLHPDPLAPVAEVEGILVVAWQQHSRLALAVGAALAVAALSPAFLGRRSHPATLPLSTYMTLVALMPALGAYPVPLVGMTVSPILGFWLGVGLLAAARASQSAA